MSEERDTVATEDNEGWGCGCGILLLVAAIALSIAEPAVIQVIHAVQGR